MKTAGVLLDASTFSSSPCSPPKYALPLVDRRRARHAASRFRARPNYIAVGARLRNGRLRYQTDDHGDRIMDFSHAGYMGGGVALPDVPVKATVNPPAARTTPPRFRRRSTKSPSCRWTDGFRGAVLLAPGHVHVRESITISASGVVLRGSGSGEDGTTIKMVGRAPRRDHHRRRQTADAAERRAAERRDRNRRSAASASAEFIAAQTTIADAYVPAGTDDVHRRRRQRLRRRRRDRHPPADDRRVGQVHAMDTLKRDGTRRRGSAARAAA